MDYYDYLHYLSESRTTLIIAQYRRDSARDVKLIDINDGTVVHGHGEVYLQNMIEKFNADQVVYDPDTRNFMLVSELLAEEDNAEKEGANDSDIEDLL